MFDIPKLENSELALEFSVETSNRFLKLLEVWDANNAYPDEVWRDVKDTLTNISEEKLGKEMKRKKAKRYISQEVKALAEKKSQARKQGEQEKYSFLKREI